MEKKNWLIVVTIVLALLVGLLGGYVLKDILVEKESGSEVGKNNSTNENKDNSQQEQELKRVHATSLEENLKGNNISYIEPVVDGTLVFDSEKMTNTSFSLGTKQISISKTNSKVILKNSDNKEITIDAEGYDSEERIVKIYRVNELLYIDNSIHSLSIGVYNSDFVNLVEDRIDQMALPLLAGDYVYYGLMDCNGPGEFGDVAVYKVNINSQKKEFLFYLDHLAGWAC